MVKLYNNIRHKDPLKKAAEEHNVISKTYHYTSLHMGTTLLSKCIEKKISRNSLKKKKLGTFAKELKKKKRLRTLKAEVKLKDGESPVHGNIFVVYGDRQKY